MGTLFWIKRFLLVFCCTFLLIFLSAVLLRHREVWQASWESALWALLATVIFITNRLYRSSRGQACAICRDTVEESSIYPASEH